MAARKGTGKNAKTASAQKSRKKKSSTGGKSQVSWAVLFWLAFAIVILGFYLYNREVIAKSISTIQSEFAGRNAPVEPIDEPPESLEAEPISTSNPPSVVDRTTPSQPSQTQTEPAGDTEIVRATEPARINETAHPIEGPNETAHPIEAVQGTTRDRVLYFTQIDRSGVILRVKVDRKFPVSDSPLTDVLRALITGPNGEETQKGLITLIPANTKILSATVRGDTAYISFSEDFQYNTYGVEGYAGQVRQIVFTATEFPNVRDVQILIEGRRVDYLGEGVWIGSPLSREML